MMTFSPSSTRVAGDLGVVGGGAADGDEGTVEAEQLLDRVRDELGAVPEQRRDLGLAAEADHHLPERAGGGLEPARGRAAGGSR